MRSELEISRFVQALSDEELCWLVRDALDVAMDAGIINYEDRCWQARRKAVNHAKRLAQGSELDLE